MIEVDARGLSCPIPVLKAKQALEKNPDSCCVLVDAYVQVENVRRLAAKLGYACDAKLEGDMYRIRISKEGAGHA